MKQWRCKYLVKGKCKFGISLAKCNTSCPKYTPVFLDKNAEFFTQLTVYNSPWSKYGDGFSASWFTYNSDEIIEKYDGVVPFAREYAEVRMAPPVLSQFDWSSNHWGMSLEGKFLDTLDLSDKALIVFGKGLFFMRCYDEEDNIVSLEYMPLFLTFVNDGGVQKGEWRPLYKYPYWVAPLDLRDSFSTLNLSPKIQIFESNLLGMDFYYSGTQWGARAGYVIPLNNDIKKVEMFFFSNDSLNDDLGSGFVVLIGSYDTHTVPDSTSTWLWGKDLPHILSADEIYHNSQVDFTNIQNVKATVNRNARGTTTVTITVPKSFSETTIGFQSGKKPTLGANNLKIGNIAEFKIGYKADDAIDDYTFITGLITDISETDESYEVKISDWTSVLSNMLTADFPRPIDYWSVMYFGDLSLLNGPNAEKCYKGADGWRTDLFIRSLLLFANIMPSNLYDYYREPITDLSNLLDYNIGGISPHYSKTYYKIFDTFAFDKHFYYNQGFLKYRIGSTDTLSSVLDKLLVPIGRRLRISENGNLELVLINRANEFIPPFVDGTTTDDGSFNVSSTDHFAWRYDANSLFGFYLSSRTHAASETAAVSWKFVAKRLDIHFIPLSDTTVHIKIENLDSSEIQEYDLEIPLLDNQFYLNNGGFTHTIEFENLTKFKLTISDTSSGIFAVEGFSVYYNSDTPYVLKSLREQNFVSSFEQRVSIENVRNDIIVLGKQVISQQVGNNFETIQDTTIASRATDVDSIYNENSQNFIGRRFIGLISEKSISNQSLANYLATFLLERLTRQQPTFSIKIVGYPDLLPYQKVKLNFANISIWNYEETYYIQDVNISIDENVFTSFSINAKPMVTSYMERPNFINPLFLDIDGLHPDVDFSSDLPVYFIYFKNAGMLFSEGDIEKYGNSTRYLTLRSDINNGDTKIYFTVNEPDGSTRDYFVNEITESIPVPDGMPEMGYIVLLDNKYWVYDVEQTPYMSGDSPNYPYLGKYPLTESTEKYLYRYKLLPDEGAIELSEPYNGDTISSSVKNYDKSANYYISVQVHPEIQFYPGGINGLPKLCFHIGKRGWYRLSIKRGALLISYLDQQELPHEQQPNDSFYVYLTPGSYEKIWNTYDMFGYHNGQYTTSVVLPEANIGLNDGGEDANHDGGGRFYAPNSIVYADYDNDDDAQDHYRTRLTAFSEKNLRGTDTWTGYWYLQDEFRSAHRSFAFVGKASVSKISNNRQPVNTQFCVNRSESELFSFEGFIEQYRSHITDAQGNVVAKSVNQCFVESHLPIGRGDEVIGLAFSEGAVTARAYQHENWYNDYTGTDDTYFLCYYNTVGDDEFRSTFKSEHNAPTGLPDLSLRGAVFPVIHPDSVWTSMLFGNPVASNKTNSMYLLRKLSAGDLTTGQWDQLLNIHSGSEQHIYLAKMMYKHDSSKPGFQQELNNLFENEKYFDYMWRLISFIYQGPFNYWHIYGSDSGNGDNPWEERTSDKIFGSENRNLTWEHRKRINPILYIVTNLDDVNQNSLKIKLARYGNEAGTWGPDKKYIKGKVQMKIYAFVFPRANYNDEFWMTGKHMPSIIQVGDYTKDFTDRWYDVDDIDWFEFNPYAVVGGYGISDPNIVEYFQSLSNSTDVSANIFYLYKKRGHLIKDIKLHYFYLVQLSYHFYDISGRGWSGVIPLIWIALPSQLFTNSEEEPYKSARHNEEIDEDITIQEGYECVFKRNLTIPSIGLMEIGKDGWFGNVDVSPWWRDVFGGGDSYLEDNFMLVEKEDDVYQLEAYMMLSTIFLKSDRYLSYYFSKYKNDGKVRMGFERHWGEWVTVPYFMGYTSDIEEWIRRFGV